MKVVIFILFLFLEIGVFNLILALKTNNDHDLEFSILEYEVVFLIVAITAILLGFCFCNIFRSWTPAELITKMENIEEINNVILSLYQKKKKLIIENPELKKLPDSVNVEIK
jgi:hypothetical protein